MRLSQPFIRLSVLFDAERLRREVADMPSEAWAKHPNDIEGNSSVRLISVGGGANDEVNGRMAPTEFLRQSPYIRQVLGSFGVVWGRSRLMRLAPGASVPSHADINYHWFSRVRVHIPIITNPAVTFYCGDEGVHMAAGEAWLFDSWRQHRVENPSAEERIHLVADTSGSSSFWNFVVRSRTPGTPVVAHRFDPSRDVQLLIEQAVLAPVMRPAEVDLLVMDLRTEIEPIDESPELESRSAMYHAMLDNFVKDWRQLYLLHAESPAGTPEFVKLRDTARIASTHLGEGLILRSNRVDVHSVFEGRVLRTVLAPAPTGAAPQPVAAAPSLRSQPGHSAPPVFIVAAPRSGSTLLFETLAASEHFVTLGGEAHELVEDIPELGLGVSGVDSNRLTAAQATAAVAARIRTGITEGLLDHRGARVSQPEARRFLEKTPKNALRIPFFDALFPDAQFVFLWRDPRSNISSIIEAWRSGRFKTYNGLNHFDGPWSLLLPPGWPSMNGRPIEEIAAFQWRVTNETIMQDLDSIAPHRWRVIDYAALAAAPAATVAGILQFLGLTMDPALQARVSIPLPLSRHTQTAPAADKWRRNADLIDRVFPMVESTWRKLAAFGPSHTPNR